MTTPNKTTALQTTQTKPRALEVMAARLNIDPGKMMSTLKGTMFKDCTDEELAMMVLVCNEYRLNPFVREIYAFPKKGGGIVPVVGVDGWNKMLLRQDNFDGIEFAYENNEDDGKPISCTATVFIKERAHPVKVTEYFDECARDTDPWRKMPRRMLRHKALCQAARMAFGISGVYDEDEAIDIVTTVMPDTGPGSRVRALPPEVAGRLQSDAAEIIGAMEERKRTHPEEHQPATQSQPTKPADARAEMQALLDENEIPFNVLRLWGDELGSIPDATSYASLAEVPMDVLERLMKAKKSMLPKLLEIKNGMVR